MLHILTYILTLKRAVPFHFLLGVGATESAPPVAVRCARCFMEETASDFKELLGGRPQRVRV